MENKKGLFINFEGIDGCGKDTQVALLSKKLQGEGHQLFLGLEPTYTFEPGKRLRRILVHELPAPARKEMQYIYYEDRKEHVEKMIGPMLEVGATVVENRYMFSTIAYGTAFGVDYDIIREWHKDMPIPDLNIYLDLPAKVAVERLAKNGKPEYFDKEDSLSKIHESYSELWERDEWKNLVVIIDGEKSIEEIHELIWERVKKLLEDK
ncbi:dTMP kinase [Patescibacteria group bacterium]|nr:dTMP kinase [Patescibacteria group bacterium]